MLTGEQMIISCYTSPVCFFNDTATTEIYTLSLHDALPIWTLPVDGAGVSLFFATDRRLPLGASDPVSAEAERLQLDRKSTRLNSSHANISYAVFCLQKKNTSSSLLPPPTLSITPMTSLPPT